MAAQILDGKLIAAQRLQSYQDHVAVLSAAGIKPALAVILVGDDPASAVYVRNKKLASERAGIRSLEFRFSAASNPQDVLATIAELNNDASVHGILVQLPLPAQFNEAEVLAAVAVTKDVDGFHAQNVGRMVQNLASFLPCTPHGVMKMLEYANVKIDGAEAVVVGRSNIVGKPMAMLLLHAGATVTVCHSRTQNLAAHCRRADILVAAIGKANFIHGDMIKPGAVLIDVGINRISDGPQAGKLCGDLHFASCQEKASIITPVPGGVGPMTINMLLANTLLAAELQLEKTKELS